MLNKWLGNQLRKTLGDETMVLGTGGDTQQQIDKHTAALTTQSGTPIAFGVHTFRMVNKEV